MGILLDLTDPHVARQNPQDYLDGLISIVTGAVDQAKAADPSFDPADIIGIGIDTTGSTVIPVDAEGTPLGLKPEFRDELAAMVWLWKDHTRLCRSGPDHEDRGSTPSAVSGEVWRDLFFGMVVEQDLALPQSRPAYFRCRM